VPSSTSASNGNRAAKALVVLLGLLLAYFGGLEVLTRAGFTRTSRIQRKIAEARKEALSLQPRTADGAESVLILANSLCREGVDPAKLRQGVSPNYHTVLLAVGGTAYVDWYFGLRRLFAEGSRPTTVILCLSTRQLISQTTDGEYFAHYMMQGRDVLAVRKSAGLDFTTTTTYWFANGSAWIGSRSSIKNWFLGELMPNIDELTGHFPLVAGPMPPTDVVVGQGLARLEDVQALCKTYNARFLFLIPPLLQLDGHFEELQTAAKQAGINVLLPYREAEMPKNYFTDGFHLNSQGAFLFTERLGQTLLRELPTNGPGAIGPRKKEGLTASE
jgi:hypothetical protein